MTSNLKKINLFKKILISSFLGCLVIIIIFFGLLEKQLNKKLPLQHSQLLTVKKGSSVASFAQILMDKGWLANRFWLRSYARLNPDKVKIKAGTYQIMPDFTLSALLEHVSTGVEHQFSVTFIEGSTFKEWLGKLEQEPNLSYNLSTLSIGEIAKRLTIEQSNPEGWFFPETYAYTQGTSAIDLLKRAHSVMQQKLKLLWQQRAKGLPYKNSYEALIMASIIEKETGYLAEQPLIASVFINRLAKRMRLQTDPTVIYGLGERYQGDITRAHLREKTAYNTYRINGLPPTPIAMPGISAIEAALNPASSDYFYFVSQGDGKHVFSKTLKKHNIAVRKFLARQKNKK
ncbi:MAG: endolytic transglycosylase MltG [Colwellia sp.]|nr:endolytic transglycosylase MltG [Colwellia sp.]